MMFLPSLAFDADVLRYRSPALTIGNLCEFARSNVIVSAFKSLAFRMGGVGEL